MPSQQPSVPPAPPAKKSVPPTSLLGSTLEHDTVIDINEKLNSKNPDTRAEGAMDFYKILEQKPDLADKESPYRPLVDAFITKILRDPNDVVRQPGLLAFETGLYHYPNPKISGLLNELAEGEGLHGIESDVVEDIIADESKLSVKNKQGLANSGQLALPQTTGSKLNIQENGLPMMANGINTVPPMALNPTPIHHPAITPQDFDIKNNVALNDAGQTNPLVSNNANTSIGVPPDLTPKSLNVPPELNQSNGNMPPQGMDITQFMTPETLENALALMPPEVQNDPKMREIMTNPELLTQMLNADPTMKAQANAMLQSSMANMPPMPGSTNVNGNAGLPPLPPGGQLPDFANMDLGAMLTPENIAMAKQFMPPELRDNPMVQQMLENPEMMKEMMKTMPPQEMAMAKEMIDNTPVSMDMLPQNLKEAKQLGYSNVDQGNYGIDGIGRPTTEGNRLDITSTA